MARNLAQLVFLVYALLLIFAARGVVGKILRRKIGNRAYRRGQRGFVNAALYLRLQDSVPPVLFWLNVMSVTTFALCLLLHLTLGWFSFAALGMKIFNAATLLIAAFSAWTLSVAETVRCFGKPFVLYRADPDPNTLRPFVSSLVEGVLYGAIPFCLAFCNFFAL